MLVIIPHPTEELKLIKFCKELISVFSKDDSFFYRTIPLWIKLDNPFFSVENDLKTIADKITSISLSKPDIKGNEVFCPVCVEYNNHQIITNLSLLKFSQEIIDDKTKLNLLKKLAASEIFPMQLKIFRIGYSVEVSSNSQAISSSVWKKIK